MLEGMSCQRRMIGFDIQLEILIQTIVLQKANRRGSIKIILMLCRLLGLGFNIKISFETNAPAVFHRHFHKCRNVFQLEFHIGIQQCFIAFPASPEYIAPAAQLYGKIQSFLDLCRGKTIYIRGIGAPCPVHKSWIVEHICRSPKKLFPGVFHLFPDIIGNLIQTRIGPGDGFGLRHQIRIMKTEIFDAQFLHELKACIDFCPGMFHGADL